MTVRVRKGSVSQLPESPATHPLEAGRWALQEKLSALNEGDFCNGVQAVADEIPVAVGVEFVNVRVLGLDRMLHLVGAAGCTTMEIRRRAFEPLAVAVVRETVSDGRHDALAESLGVRWLCVAWVEHGGETLGTLAAGTRTKRRPDEAGVRLFHDVVDRLAEPFSRIDRRPGPLRACSLRLARAWTPPEWFVDGPAAKLRPRERTILELYADGLSTGDIAELLVISPHTVRTHVKLALRRLGVHAREEAATLVRGDQVAQII